MQKIGKIAIIFLMIFLVFNMTSFAVTDGITIPTIGLDVKPATNAADAVNTVQIIILLTVLSLAPSILIMTTCFTRIIIILSFLRNALGTQQMPPNQIMVGLALFLTFFIMTPTFSKINTEAFAPFIANQISQQEAFEKAKGPLKDFMLKQLRDEEDLKLFMRLGNIENISSPQELPISVIIPAFIVSELKIAFQIGFILYIPFLVIDMIVSSTLMAMGMMMLPPVMISLPFKILLFVLIDGWSLVVQMIVTGFR